MKSLPLPLYFASSYRYRWNVFIWTIIYSAIVFYIYILCILKTSYWSHWWRNLNEYNMTGIQVWLRDKSDVSNILYRDTRKIYNRIWYVCVCVFWPFTDGFGIGLERRNVSKENEIVYYVYTSAYKCIFINKNNIPLQRVSDRQRFLFNHAYARYACNNQLLSNTLDKL